MKSTSLFALVFAATMCAACGGAQSGGDGGPVTINVAAGYPGENVSLQAVADVEYVPLAISDEALLSPDDRVFHLSDRYIMVSVRRTGTICVFDRAGAIVSHFGRQGRGPGEYAAFGDAVFDPAAEEIFVTDRMFPKIEVYTLVGEHKRTLTLPEGWQVAVFDFDEESLLAYDEGGVAAGGEYGTAPYHLISKTDGSVAETLGIEVPVRYSQMHVWSESDAGGETRYLPMVMTLTNNRVNGGDFTLADISSDTVYNYTRERVPTPAFVRRPSVHASEPRVVWGMELLTDDFVVFEVQTLDFESIRAGSYPPIRSLKYDRATGKTTEVMFTNDDNPSEPWSNYGINTAGLPRNTTARMLSPLRLKDALEKGELSGPLADIAAKIKEDDNPVVMIVKFK